MALGNPSGATSDPALPEGWYKVTTSAYTGSGFDRGHNVPSADRTRTVADNSTTFLMTNIIPQAMTNPASKRRERGGRRRRGERDGRALSRRSGLECGDKDKRPVPFLKQVTAENTPGRWYPLPPGSPPRCGLRRCRAFS